MSTVVLSARREGKAEALRKLEEFLSGAREVVVDAAFREPLTLEDPFGGGGQWTPLGNATAFWFAMTRALPRWDTRLLERAARALA